MLIFTEFKDTLGLPGGEAEVLGLPRRHHPRRHEAGLAGRAGFPSLHAEQQFRDGHIQVLVATEAAGEGINLQCCHILFNYDIPWNPNRLEQRMGRIHRYGQRFDCLIFNFVATNTIEGRVLQRLLVKLQEIRDALDDDAVFNVVGEVLPAAQVDRVFRDYYSGKLGDADLEDRLLRDVDEGRFREICQTALEGLAAKKLNLEMLVERRARAQERRVVPETIARFLSESSGNAAFTLSPVSHLRHTFQPGRTPTALKRYERDPDWRFPDLSDTLPPALDRPGHGGDAQPGMGYPRAPAIRGAAPSLCRNQQGCLSHGRVLPLSRPRCPGSPRLLSRPGRRRSRPRHPRAIVRRGVGRDR